MHFNRCLNTGSVAYKHLAKEKLKSLNIKQHTILTNSGRRGKVVGWEIAENCTLTMDWYNISPKIN